MRPWVDLRWWPVALTLGAAAALVAVASVLGARRDLGAGLVPSRPGHRHGARWLGSPAGLAWHELTGDVVAWAAGLGAFAVLFGAMTSTMVDAMADIPMIREWMALDPDAVTETLLAAEVSYFTLGAAAFAVTATLHLRHEEVAGTAAVAVVDGPGRLRWLVSWLLVVCGATLVVQVAGGLGLGVGVAIDGGDWSAPLDLAGDALVVWPAVLVFVGLVLFLFGVAPRLVALAWAVVSWALVRVDLRGVHRPADLGDEPVTGRGRPARSLRGGLCRTAVGAVGAGRGAVRRRRPRVPAPRPGLSFGAVRRPPAGVGSGRVRAATGASNSSQRRKSATPGSMKSASSSASGRSSQRHMASNVSLRVHAGHGDRSSQSRPAVSGISRSQYSLVSGTKRRWSSGHTSATHSAPVYSSTGSKPSRRSSVTPGTTSGPCVGSGSMPDGGAQALTWWTQVLAVGLASSRAGSMGRWQTSQMPYVPAATRARAASTSSRWSRVWLVTADSWERS